MSTEQEDLTTLVTHPGFLRLQRYAEEEWAAKLATHVTSAANERDDVIALHHLRQVIAAKRAVEQLLAWPAERLQILAQRTERAHLAPSLSRRGGL